MGHKKKAYLKDVKQQVKQQKYKSPRLNTITNTRKALHIDIRRALLNEAPEPAQEPQPAQEPEPAQKPKPVNEEESIHEAETAQEAEAAQETANKDQQCEPSENSEDASDPADGESATEEVTNTKLSSYPDQYLNSERIKLLIGGLV